MTKSSSSSSSSSSPLKLNGDGVSFPKQSLVRVDEENENIFIKDKIEVKNYSIDSDNDDDDDDDENGNGNRSSRTKARKGAKHRGPSAAHRPFIENITKTAIIHPDNITKLLFKVVMGTVVTLYVLNQKHVLPKPLSAIVSKTLFWPTLPITISRRIGKWCTDIDDTVVIGGAPFGFLGYPKKLYNDYGVRGVINMCEEYHGPCKAYKELGMNELWLPTTDHFEPSLLDLQKAVAFIQKYKDLDVDSDDKGRVYVHCRAGHGRSAAVVFAWLLSQENGNISSVDLQKLNESFCVKRDVRKTLWKQKNILEFRSWLHIGRAGDNDTSE